MTADSVTSEPHVASYYAASVVGGTTYPTLRGAVEADICIVGGGYAGLSAALELAERGFDVVLLEANRVGWGASGRNGGQIVTGYAAGMGQMRKWVGRDDARRLWALAEEAKALLRDRVRDHAIDCDLKAGYLFAALKDRHIDELRAEKTLWEDEYGYPGLELVDRDGVRAEVDTSAYCGGLLDSGGGHLHPLNYALGLARAALAGGVRVFEGARVLRIDRGPRPSVTTAQGSVSARHLVLCGNAYLGDMVPELRRKIMPVGTYIIATAPLSADRAKALIANDIAVADVKLALDYYRLSADRRVLFGGKVSYTTLPPRNLAAAMRRAMLRVFPQLGDLGVDYVWGGNVAITAERSPHIGRLDGGIYFAQGFSGHGVALTGIAGRVIAEAVAGTAERFDLFARLPHQSFVGGRALRTPLLALAMLYFRLRDLL
jgi:gamma-glutamylputrescine oxidase